MSKVASMDAPVAMPDDGGMYQWDESTTSWVAVEQEQA
jgi:hypothetical protein